MKATHPVEIQVRSDKDPTWIFTFSWRWYEKWCREPVLRNNSHHPFVMVGGARTSWESARDLFAARLNVTRWLINPRLTNGCRAGDYPFPVPNCVKRTGVRGVQD